MSPSTYPVAVHESYSAPTVVLFTSPTCGPCRGMKPILADLAEKLAFPYAELSIQHHMNDALALGIRAVPALLVLKNGAVLGQFLGGKTEREIREILGEHGVTQNQLEF